MPRAPIGASGWPALRRCRRFSTGRRASRSGRAERRLTLSEEMVAELRGFVRRHGLTLGTLIHAAWAVVLAQ